MREHGFVFLPSYYEAIKGLDGASRLAIMDAILGYVFEETEPELSPLLKCCFTLLRPNIDASMKKYRANVENGKKGGRPPKNKPDESLVETQPKPIDNPTETQLKPGENQEKEKEKEKDIWGTGKPSNAKKFIPPSLEEVRAYCQERGNNVDPQRFLDHYTASGWMRGKTPIKEWKACVRTWEKKEEHTEHSRLESTFAGRKPRKLIDDVEHEQDENGDWVPVERSV